MQNYNEILKGNVERLSDTQRMFADQASNIFQTTFASAVKLMELQTSNAQSLFLRKLGWIEEAKGLKEERDVLEFQKKVYQSEAEHFLAQSKEVTDLFFQTQEQIDKLATENFNEVSDTINQAIDEGLRATTGSASSPVALMVKQGIDTQREAFDKVLAMTRQNWEQGFSQIREAAQKGAEQVQQVQNSQAQNSAGKTGRGRRKA